MDHGKARTAGQILFVCGCIFIILNQIWFALALVALGLLVMLLRGRCPHCGGLLMTLLPGEETCPRCRRSLNKPDDKDDQTVRKRYGKKEESRSGEKAS